MRTWAAKHTPHVDLKTGTAEFVDFWRALPGTRARKLNWESTWRNRMRELEAKALGSGPGRRAPTETKFERMQRALADDE